MKIKSHKSKWAMALCAVALFSFTAAHAAQARVLPAANLDQGKTPQATTDHTAPRLKPVELPPAPPSSMNDGPAQNGTFNGKVIAD